MVWKWALSTAPKGNRSGIPNGRQPGNPEQPAAPKPATPSPYAIHLRCRLFIGALDFGVWEGCDEFIKSRTTIRTPDRIVPSQFIIGSLSVPAVIGLVRSRRPGGSGFASRAVASRN